MNLWQVLAPTSAGPRVVNGLSPSVFKEKTAARDSIPQAARPKSKSRPSADVPTDKCKVFDSLTTERFWQSADGNTYVKGRWVDNSTIHVLSLMHKGAQIAQQRSDIMGQNQTADMMMQIGLLVVSGELDPVEARASKDRKMAELDHGRQAKKRPACADPQGPGSENPVSVAPKATAKATKKAAARPGTTSSSPPSDESARRLSFIQSMDDASMI